MEEDRFYDKLFEDLQAVMWSTQELQSLYESQFCGYQLYMCEPIDYDVGIFWEEAVEIYDREGEQNLIELCRKSIDLSQEKMINSME